LSEEVESSDVYLIDSSIYIFQAHFSPFVECFDENGGELSALFGFAQFLLQFLRRVKPDYVATAHDESLFCGFRHQLSPDYKSNRELPDENLEMQLKGCSELCSIMGLPTFSSKVYEADDIIGTLANSVRHNNSNVQVQILSKDKDLAQLLKSANDCLWDYNQNSRRYRTDIFEEFGVHPEQFPDYLGLIGDSVDCISGVPGVGPVKAKALLQQFKSIEEIYQNIGQVSSLELRGASGLVNKLQEYEDLAYLSKQLATIVCEVSDPEELFGSVALDELKPVTPNKGKFLEFLDLYNFSEPDKIRLAGLAASLSAR
jgi:5'-3' exonuclease